MALLRGLQLRREEELIPVELPVEARLLSQLPKTQLIEVGATIIHSANRHMVEFANDLNLKRAAPFGHGPSIGIWDGRSFLFYDVAPDISSWLDRVWVSARSYLRLLWRYGLGLLKLQSFVQGLLDRFCQVYSISDRQPFGTVEGLLSSLDLHWLTQRSLDSVLLEKGVRPRLVNELVAMVMRINYGQNTTLNALAGSISLAGSGSDLWRVAEGNVRLVSGLVGLAGATLHLNASVAGIKALANGSYEVQVLGAPILLFDAVIISTPLETAALHLHPPVDLPLRHFQHTHATIVRGLINHTYFGLTSAADVPSIIGTVETPSVPFSSIGVQRVHQPGADVVYKVFSRTQPSEGLLAALFSRVDAMYHIDWPAYPHFSPPEVFSPFRIDHRHLYYLNTIENAASAIEMSAVAADNVVRLMLEDLEIWRKQPTETIPNREAHQSTETAQPTTVQSTASLRQQERGVREPEDAQQQLDARPEQADGHRTQQGDREL